MILVDYREGSKELLVPLAAAGLPVQEDTLEFGDLAFMGRGVAGADVWIGIEHKKLPDLVQSLTTERLAGHQLGGMVTTYDRSYLVVEGEWDATDSGRITMPGKWRGRQTPLKGAPDAVVLEQRVITLETRGGQRVRWSPSQRATVRWVVALYRFWTDKALDEHKSHLAIHAPDLDPKLKEHVSDFRKGLNGAVPGLGFVLTGAIEQAVFDPTKKEGSWALLLSLSEKELADIEYTTEKGKVRRVGPAKAKTILERLR